MELTEYEKGFIESFIDADGCIHLSKYRVSENHLNVEVKLTFSNNSKKLLDKVQTILKTSKKYHYNQKRQSYNLSYTHGVCRELLPLIELVIKEKKRRIAIKILSLMKAGHNRYVNNTKEIIKLCNLFEAI